VPEGSSGVNSFYAVLEEGVVLPVDWQTWAEWIEKDRDFGKRRVANTQIGNAEVSTFFLAVDFHFGHGKPHWFETLVRGGWLDMEMERYASLEEALLGHEHMCAKVRKAEGTAT
jgi:hypothetical protein